MASINSSTVSYQYPLALARFFRVIISFFSIFLIFLVMTPAVLAQNDEITISYSGRLQYGCTLRFLAVSSGKGWLDGWRMIAGDDT